VWICVSSVCPASHWKRFICRSSPSRLPKPSYHILAPLSTRQPQVWGTWGMTGWGGTYSLRPAASVSLSGNARMAVAPLTVWSFILPCRATC